ncbi:peptidyl-glycine alpha-amidating monooxygenase-like isoform X2 [Halichondria panicea]|uniref:peptidyl-glycine alpha-amidating monooxygenase-like isoform X2 n=1 Tax=Halichondria panicea TaxID=6063 RepID=UPI00312B560D
MATSMKQWTMLCLSLLLAVSLSLVEGEIPTTTITIPMPSPDSPPKHNDYMCVGVSLPRENSYIVGYEPRADSRVVHHMLMFGCPGSVPQNTWSCKSTPSVCPNGGYGKILYAWALNASGLQLPQDVGMQIGPSVKVMSLVIQIHYGHPETVPDLEATSQESVVLHTSKERQKNVAGIYIMGGTNSLEAGKKEVFSDSACKFAGPNNIYPFAFRTHSHSLGHQIVGYIVKPEGKWELIGTRSPQDAQTFYPAASPSLEVVKGDTLALRCVFNTLEKTHTVRMGPDSEDEMCNFYIMYYTANNGRGLYADDCWDPPRGLTYPSTLPPLPVLVSSSEPHHHHSMGGDKDEEDKDDDYKCPVSVPPGNPSRCPVPTTAPPTTHPPITPPPFIEGVAAPPPTLLGLAQAEDWALNKVSIPGRTLGQVSAVAADGDGNVHILHRGSVKWDYGSFYEDYTYARVDQGPIKEPTLLKFTSTGTPQIAWGEKFFYLPHGLTIDSQGAFWVTDVAMHQVFKFTKLGDKSPSLTLGIAFKPGSGFGHFCQPASVAVETSGVFYVADGYCNRRVLKFSAQGTLMETWDGPVSSLPLFIPHKASLSRDQSTLYIADRENQRVLSYDTSTGAAMVFSGPLESAVYAVCVNGSGGWPMYGVYGGKPGSMGFSLDSHGEVMNTWGPSNGFSKPHDITVDTVHGAVYVTEIGPNRIWKFVPLYETNSNETSNTTADVESVDGHHGNGPSEIVTKRATFNVGIFVAIFVVVLVILIILVGILREHKYLKKLRLYVGSRRKTAGAAEGGGVKVEARGKKGIPLHSLLGPSRPGFSRLKTYDSDSEDEDFPVFNRV